MYMCVQIDNDTALDMLIDRVKYWTDDDVSIGLFEQYYSRMIDDCAFNGIPFDVKYIVDNDYINYFVVTTREDAKDDYPGFTEDNIFAEDEDGNILYYCC